MKKNLILIFLFIAHCTLYAKDYNASMFGIKSDGSTLNTRSIQKAVDFIHQQGGGALVFYVGRYLTGTVYLKSNVTIRLHEGAVILGSTVIYDYRDSAYSSAIFMANGQQNIKITGLGVIDGNSDNLNKQALLQVSNGYIASGYMKPSLINFVNCQSVTVDSINLFSSSGTVQLFKDCSNIKLQNLTVKNTPRDIAAVELHGCNDIFISNSYFDINGSGIVATNSNDIKITNTKDQNGSYIFGNTEIKKSYKKKTVK